MRRSRIGSLIHRSALGLRLLAALLWVVTAGARHASAAPSANKATPTIDDGDRVPLGVRVPPRAKPELDVGRADLDLPMERMVMSLKRRPGGDDALRGLIAQLHDPHSSLFHRWLTPAELGARFGLDDSQLATVSSWLTGHGFRIDQVARGRGWINFSGTVRQVESAFATEIDDFVIDGTTYHANVGSASLPRGIADLANGVVTLHSFPRPAHHTQAMDVVPDFTSGGAHYVAPSDFMTIYDLNGAYTSGYTGTGQTIAIVGRSDILASDVTTFRTKFGLSSYHGTVNFVHNGPDPGLDRFSSEELAHDVAVEWAGAVAPDATVDLVISGSTNSTDGSDLSAEYIVDDALPVAAMDVPFWECEADMGPAENALWNSIYQQAVSEGITPFAIAGETGASACDDPDSSTGSGAAVSGLCSTPYDVCVGGSQFDDTANSSLYWSSSNNAAGGSARSYIPEVAWNESGTVAGGSGLDATGGGKSTVYAKPAWQAGPGVPADGQRDVPDVSLSAASHDGYLAYQEGTLYVVGGPAVDSFTGLMALIAQKNGHQGNANTVLYPMAAEQSAGIGATVFHDITSGNNSVPGVTGFSAGIGYDLVTGLGSVDGTALINHWGQMTLSVAKTGNGSGTVTSSPAGVSCGATCSASYAYDTAVSLTASAATGSTFTGWSGAGCSGTGTCQVTMSAARSVTANFDLQKFTLSVTKAGNGSGTVTSSPAGISCGDTCSAPYDYNTVVTLTASAATGSTFTGWSGGGCSGTGTCQVTISAAQSVTATFTLQQFMLSVAKAGSGSGTVTGLPAGINCGDTCSGSYDYNTLVTLTASASTGSTFTGWSGGGCSGSGTCQVTMSAAQSVTATFTPQQFTLSVSKTGSGSGTVTGLPAGISCGDTCSGSYDYNTVVTLTASAATGSTFTGWSGGGCSGTDVCQVTLNAAQGVVAGFDLLSFELSVSRDGIGSGNVTSSPAGIDCGNTCGADFDYGTVVTLTATADAGSRFTGWTSAPGCSNVQIQIQDGANVTCQVTMEAAKDVTATFDITYTLTVTQDGSGIGTVTSSPAGIDCGASCTADFDSGTLVTLTPIPANDASFAGWSGDCIGTGACMVTMGAARIVTATFAKNIFVDGFESGDTSAWTFTVSSP